MGNSGRSVELEEIWSLFAQEGRENLLGVEASLLLLEKSPNDPEQVAALFRAMHTFKGSVRMMGLTVMESLAHHAEDLIALVRDEGVALEEEMINVLLATLDRLRTMLDYALAYGHDVDPDQAEESNAKLEQMIAEKKPATQEQGLPADSAIDLGVSASPEPDRASPISGEVLPTQDERPAAGKSWFTEPSADALAKFLQAAENALTQLHSALDAFAAGSVEALGQINVLADDLRNVTEKLGYLRLAGVLETLSAEAQPSVEADASPQNSEAHLLRLKKLELTLFEEITQIQDTAPGLDAAGVAEWTNIAWLFRHWNAERVFADLARLSEITDYLERQANQFTLDVNTSGENARLAEEATLRLRAIYHSCVFYHLDSAVHLTLALEDLYGRVAQGELLANEALTNLARVYVTNLGSAIEAIHEGESPETQVLLDLIKQVENFLYLNADGPVLQVTRSVLDVLKLPVEFKEVMAPEALVQFSRALDAGEHFYTILADLERNQEIGAAFFEWSGTEGVRLITNITVYRYRRTLFNFLLATTLSREALLKALQQIDPEWKYLTLEECVLREEVTRETKREETPQLAVEHEIETSVQSHDGVSVEVLGNLMDTVGAMVADQATLRRVVDRLDNTDPVETVLQLVKTIGDDPARLRRELQNLLREWTDGIHAFGQVTNQMGAALGRLQELARSLRLVPVAEMLNPLQHTVQDLVRRQGKLVDLDLQGGEQELDRGVMQILAEPIRRLVWFAVVQGIEDAESRRVGGKPAGGRVVVKVNVREDQAQVVVEDDGCGVDRAMIRERAAQLGWHSPTAAEELGLLLKPGFGPVGSGNGVEGLDLAALSADLRARHGRLSVASEVGKGTRFDIRLPLDMAVVDGMVVRVGEIRYIVPVKAVQRIVTASTENLVHSSAEGKHTLLRFEGELVQLRTLNGHENSKNGQGLVVVVDSENGRVALRIDELLGQQQVLVRPLQGQLAEVKDISGCALLGEGEVGMVLNLGALGMTAAT